MVVVQACSLRVAPAIGRHRGVSVALRAASDEYDNESFESAKKGDDSFGLMMDMVTKKRALAAKNPLAEDTRDPLGRIVPKLGKRIKRLEPKQDVSNVPDGVSTRGIIPLVFENG